MTAAADAEVRAVVAVSPFVGLNDYVTWGTKNAKTGTLWYRELKILEEIYGSQVNSKEYNERSPATKKIQSPVLLLQGTADHHVSWETVQMFYQQMKASNKVVKFVLYPGGHHGLHGQYSIQSTQEIDAWFHKYGLSGNF